MTPERLAEIEAYAAVLGAVPARVLGELLAAYEERAQKLSNSYATIEGLADELAEARASYTELDHRNDELAFYNAAAFRRAEELQAEREAQRERMATEIAKLRMKLASAEAALAKAREELKAKSGLVLEANRKLEEWKAIAKERGERNDLNEADLRTLGAALEKIAESRDAGRHDGLPEPYPAHSDYEMWGWANEALAAIRATTRVRE